MFRSLKKTLLASIVGAALFVPSSVYAGEKYSFGKAATAEEIAGWDIDIRPDGKGLPNGGGSVEDGEVLYEQLCATCHGLFGEGEARWPVLAGGLGTLTEERPTKTVGSYWPYASTLYDYIRRAMPFTAPRSLTNEQTYQLTAYVLYLNELVDEDFVLTHENLAQIQMPNKDGFFVDPRPDVKNIRCMKDCDDPSRMKIEGTLKGITPVGHFIEGADAPAASHEGQEDLEREKAHARKAALTGEEVQEEAVPEAVQLSDKAIAGKETFDNACKVCHGSGIAGSPKLGDIEAWAPRVKQDLAVLVEHAIKGFSGASGIMPPKGGRVDLSDQQVEEAVNYMVESSK
ncbi:c-type cytochrome [Neptunomonas japonica]|uniref:Sulfur-oxidizing protein SoxD n=1 Tax=Neptunomonas japonica JAMM 1380 TaxID=1441457 RepID=A0A7R6PJD2_9GAMM|nr:c-type cytochrome [Neptunomonas japonica]BBB30186.1 sulfur-oxidizing protein SoxD [Neptunomonas japonica JAMM 1380]